MSSAGAVAVPYAAAAPAPLPVASLAVPLGLAYLSFFIAPLLMLFYVSFHDDERMAILGAGQWVSFLNDRFNLMVIANTMLLGAKTVCATIILGVPLALVYMRANPFWQRVLLFIVVMPVLTSVVVRTFAWIVILGREGLVNQLILGLGLTTEPLRLLQTELGLVISLTQIEMPLLLLPLLSVISRIDPRLVDASASLGASPWRTLFRVILPLALPGLAAGSLLVFASSTTAFISQAVIGGGRLVYLPAIIWQQAMVVSHWPAASVAAVTLMISVFGVVGAIVAAGRILGGGAGG